MPGTRIPVSTYRLQFNPQLRFSDAKALIPYLHSLGITDIYASPLLQAKRGSPHGYDVTDPSHLNSELGTDEEFDAMVAELHAHNMGLLLDIVPNHMAASGENPWWMDLLEDGPRSAFASHFDVDWHPPSRSLENRVLLPILGKPYAEVLEGREILLTYAQTWLLPELLRLHSPRRRAIVCSDSGLSSGSPATHVGGGVSGIARVSGNSGRRCPNPKCGQRTTGKCWREPTAPGGDQGTSLSTLHKHTGGAAIRRWKCSAV